MTRTRAADDFKAIRTRLEELRRERGRAKKQTRDRCGYGFAAPIAGTGAAELDPAAGVFKLPDQINWKENATAGNANAALYGDPSKPGLYIVLVKWHADHMSHPHFHPNDRFITVISGTWWVGTGTKFDREATVPMPAGSFVTHVGKQVHYDGAKEGDTVLEIVGEGPATSTPAEQK